jgi:hypothetical protein
MLTYDPCKRISAKAVLQHKYFENLEEELQNMTEPLIPFVISSDDNDE